MKTLFAVLFGAAVMAIASMSPAAAQDTSSLRCLVLDSANQSRVIDVCRCITAVSVDSATRRLLRPNPLRVSTLCPAGGGAAGFGDISSVSPPDDHGHGFSFSKASSSSSFVGIAVGGSIPFATTILGEHTTSVVIGDGGSNAVAGSGGSSVATGPGTITASRVSPGSSSSTSSTSGGTGGASCAGSSCGGAGGGGSPPG